MIPTRSPSLSVRRDTFAQSKKIHEHRMREAGTRIAPPGPAELKKAAHNVNPMDDNSIKQVKK